MQSWMIYALLSAVFASLVAIFGKIGIQGIDSTLATTVRSVIMAVFLLLVSVAFNKISFSTHIQSKTMLFIVLSGIAGALSWLFYFVALKQGPATGVAALDRLSVVFVLIFAALFLAEKLTLKTGLGVILLTLGAVLMSIK